MTEKDGACGHHKDDKSWKQYTGAIVSFIFVILLVILIIYLVLNPKKPHFTLDDITLYAFNISATTTTLTSNLQITISARNPNARIGIYYDKIDVYASYRSQQITLATQLPPSYQGHKDITVWSPYLYGTDVPVAPYLAMPLSQDMTAGTVMVNVKAAGRVRWKVGSFVSGGYHLNVNCPAYITFGEKSGGYAVGPAVKYQVAAGCNVDT